MFLTDGKGIPLSVVVDGANRHDKKLVKRTLDAIFFERPSPENIIQNICIDKGYDFTDIRKFVEEYCYTEHIKSFGEENIRRDTWFQGKKMGGRKDTFLAEQIQKTPYKMGKEN